jgi:polysaccharide deacetylase family protein (PEP-CTERM system associated)
MLPNALTIDVEEHFQVSAFNASVARESWDRHGSRVVANTHRILDLFDQYRCKATFFLLGWVVERHPELAREVVTRGHEVGCHGYSHELIYRQNPAQFTEETHRSRELIQQAAQVKVRGYRAASFSITDASRWALDVLVDAGFEYDSSMYPVKHDLYGIDVASRRPHRINAPNGGSLIEFPMTTCPVAGVSIPVSGGGYFRLYPYSLTRALLRRVNGSGESFVFYLHPWELDPEQPRIEASARSRLRHYMNLSSCETKLTRLLGDFEFAPMRDVIAASGPL